MILTFRLDGLGGCNFAGGKQANVTRLPWGGSGSELVAFVRGPLLVNLICNEERLTHFQQRVLTPTVLRIVATMIDAERAHLKTCSGLVADEKQTAGARNACTVMTARVRARLGTLQALQAQPEQAFWPGLHPLHLYDVSNVLDAKAKFSVRPARGVKDQERTRLARAFSMDSGIIGVRARAKGVEPTMKRLISKVASRLMTVKPNGDVEPLRGTFYPEELHFAEPTRAVAKAITECVVKTKMQLEVFSKQPRDESTETQHPWAWGGMSLMIALTVEIAAGRLVTTHDGLPSCAEVAAMTHGSGKLARGQFGLTRAQRGVVDGLREGNALWLDWPALKTEEIGPLESAYRHVPIELESDWGGAEHGGRWPTLPA